MRAFYLRDLRDDRGSIILALLGIIILTTVASVGLAAAVNGQGQARHDNTFTQALDNAESGIDAMAATIKGATANGTTDYYNSPGASAPPKLTLSGAYSVVAKKVNQIGQTGSASASVWTIQSTGTAVTQGRTITRVVTETLTVAHTYNAPLEGSNGINLGSTGNSVNNCSACVGAGAVNDPTVISKGITVPILGTLGSTTITDPPGDSSPNSTPGAAETGGQLVLQGGDLQNFAQVALDQGGTSNGSCKSTSDVCNSTTVVTQATQAPAITTPGCLPGAIGAALNGVGLSLPDPLGVVLNTNLVAKLDAQPPIADTVCTNLPIIIPTIGTTLSSLPLIGGLTNLTGLDASLDAPIGADCLTNGVQSVLTTLASGANLTCTMDPPQDLVINNVSNLNNDGTCSGTGSSVYLGTGTTGSPPAYVSALINNPCGNCQITGNVVLYGALECATITVPPGSTLTVEYPTDQGLTAGQTTHLDTVSNWNECEPATSVSVCQPIS
ncbi:MAG TPA: hypothetical protein VG899_13625 [Mycobacteriales bacterium]|nr:hypothetical protein [Mycobacteriales bacterium]